MKELEKEIELLLKYYIGGSKYFHALDNAIKYNSNIINELIKKYDPKDYILVLSGEVGYQIHKLHTEHEKIFITGSPRKFEKTMIYNYSKLPTTKQYIMIDDTYFSGNTFFYIRGLLKAKFDIELNNIMVAYDGGRHELDYVKSLYRYYDYHNALGEKL